MVLAQKQTHGPLEQNSETRNNPLHTVTETPIHMVAINLCLLIDKNHLQVHEQYLFSLSLCTNCC